MKIYVVWLVTEGHYDEVFGRKLTRAAVAADGLDEAMELVPASGNVTHQHVEVVGEAYSVIEEPRLLAFDPDPEPEELPEGFDFDPVDCEQ